jgi:cytoskeleton protein RodZ
MEEETPAGHIGARLKAAREASGRSLDDIATQTKVRVSLLDAIERGAVEELPAGPYAVGFVRTYARAVGIDAEAAVAEVRQMIAAKNLGVVAAATHYEPADTDRVPPRPLVWIALLIAGILVAAYLAWRTLSVPGEEEAAPTVASAPVEPATPAPATPAVIIPADAVIRIAARESAYFTLEDADGRTQFDLTLDGGEFYTVRPAQRSLILRTSRPQALRILAGDIELPAIGAPDMMTTIGLDSASLSRAASNGAGVVVPIPNAAVTSGPAGTQGSSPAPRALPRTQRAAPTATAPVAEPAPPPASEPAPSAEPAATGDAG